MEDLGAGGSGAAGGLMHPFTPRGKMLWRGDEGVDAALELLDAAEEAAGPGSETIAWRSGLIRPAKRIKHALDFAKFCSGESAKMWGNARTVTHEEATRLVPGLSLEALQADMAEKRKDGKGATTMPPGAVALHIPQGVVLHPKKYLRALWKACVSKAKAASHRGSSANIVRLKVDSLAALSACQAAEGCGQYDAIIVAAGAAAGAIQELKGKLPLQLTQGYTVDLAHREGSPPFPPGSPSLLGHVYMSVQENGTNAVIGATRRYGLTPEDALQEIGREVEVQGCPEAHAACEELLCEAHSTWPEFKSWQVEGVRSGVRALPPRTAAGSIPLAGRVLPADGNSPACWVLAGLGARGLVYHALVARWLAEAVRSDNPSALPPEVTAWQHESTST
eukprot:CAMPEP_0117659798 /NCGR_PEP_ID=MMETSP0804-20121206/6623_1 /TAXON_ID=1074897 /ORGANISM="Tetraselmis astigmatica, Strain CCMP880" /LENGTH=392 /DNA_ID=CAMNT_0005466477 /DNA_START=571 /DNA_END=1749 /DNA_ORIENTATION=-